MKNFKYLPLKYLILIFIFVSSKVYCQENFDDQIKSISATLAEEISTGNIKAVGIAEFTDLQGNVTELGKFIAEEFGVAMVNTTKELKVVDRSQISFLLRENKLSLTGFIDPQTTSQLGKIAGIKALIVGTITPFGDNLRLTVKILSTETATIIAATRGNLALTNAIKDLYDQGISEVYFPPSGGGFQSIPSGPSKEGQTSVSTEEKDPDCKTKKYGDYCFSNKTNKDIRIQLKLHNPRYNDHGYLYGDIIIHPNKSECVYALAPRHYDVFVYLNYIDQTKQLKDLPKQQRLLIVEQCNKKTLEIR